MSTPLSKRNYIIWFVAIVVFAVVLDQVTKVIMAQLLAGNNTINVLGDWLIFKWAINEGSAFGQLSGQSLLFFIVTILGTPLFVYLWWRARTRSVWGQLGFTFMIGGTIGNAIDRAFLGDSFFNGGVRDFISVDGFAIFNVADSFLVVGVIMACMAIIIFDHDSLVKEVVQERIAKQTEANSNNSHDKTVVDTDSSTVELGSDNIVDDSSNSKVDNEQ